VIRGELRAQVASTIAQASLLPGCIEPLIRQGHPALVLARLIFFEKA